jgi:hypothetical protein
MRRKCFMREIARSRQRGFSLEVIPDKINEVIADRIRLCASRLRNDATLSFSPESGHRMGLYHPPYAKRRDRLP